MTMWLFCGKEMIRHHDEKITYGAVTSARCLYLRMHLKSLGAKRGDRITLYMPMIPEAAIAMLACATNWCGT